MVVCNLFVLDRLVVVAVVLSPAVTLDRHPGVALWPRVLQRMYVIDVKHVALKRQPLLTEYL